MAPRNNLIAVKAQTVINSQKQPQADRPLPEDDLEKAIFDLQDVKNSYINEQKEYEK